MKETEIGLWLGQKSSQALKQEAFKLVNQERKERLLKDRNTDTDYGYSFPGVTSLDLSCLSEIRTDFEKTGNRPMVLDIGAGFGSMTWKILAAGAQVDAIELQAATANELNKRLQGMNTALWNGQSLDELLNVQTGDALEILQGDDYKAKYDYVWCSHVIHFMTPAQIETLKQRLNQVLKPGGKIFMRANYVYQFNFCDANRYVQAAYQQAIKSNSICPGFMTINMATLIDPLQDQIVDYKLLSAYNQEQMTANGIPLAVNAYCKGKLAGSAQAYDFKEVFSGSFSRLAYPNVYSVNKFYQTMNLFDPEIAEITFKQAGFDIVSFKLEMGSDKKPLDKNEDINITTVILMEKKRIGVEGADVDSDQPSTAMSRYESGLTRLSQFFEPAPHAKIQFKIEQLSNQKIKNSLSSALEKHDFSLLLRCACAYGNLPIVRLLLENKDTLEVNIKQTSSNGNSALDWVKKSSAESRIKNAIESLLLEHGVEQKIDSPVAQSA